MIKPLLALAAALSASAAFADTLVSNVNGMQVGPDGKLQHFKALVLSDDGKVRQVIEHPELVRLANITSTIDGGGRTLLPGLIDAHGHVMSLGRIAVQLDLAGTPSLADLRQRLGAYAAQRPADAWIVGRGWNQELWPDSGFPTAADLDSVVRERPVVLERVDGHAVVANSAALKAAGITAATRDPVGGKIERDANGNPTGLLIDGAMEIVGKVVPAATLAQLDEALAKAQEQLLRFGITATTDMGTDKEDWAAYQRAGMAGQLKVRIMAYHLGVEDIDPIRTGPSDWLHSDRLRMGGVKLYADGALGSRGAWLKRPYADQPGTRGIPRHSDAQLLEQADRAASASFQVAIHAIGDAANAQVISTFEQLAKKYPGDRRWRIEHFQVVDPKDIPRLKPAGIIASMQPTHQTSDRLMAEKRLGRGRLKGSYAWQTVEKLGIPLAFGSDYPVESPNPFPGLSAAISRQDINGQPPGGWIPSERLTFAQALAAFTRGGAYAGFAEDKIGALEPGKWADFIIIDRDPTAVDPQSLARTQVLETWVAGKKAWESEAPKASQTERGR